MKHSFADVDQHIPGRNMAFLSILAPTRVTDLTTASVRAVVGRLVTHSPLARIIPKLWLAAEMTQTTSEGENSRILR
jgi:hypothetical protein